MVFSRSGNLSGLWFFPVRVFCVPIGLVWLYDTRSVRGCSIHPLSASAIPRTGPVWGWGVCPGSLRPRARVPLVVWAWDLVVIRLLCCGLPAPARRQFFALRFVTVGR